MDSQTAYTTLGLSACYEMRALKALLLLGHYLIVNVC